MWEVRPKLVQKRHQLRAVRDGGLDEGFVPTQRDCIEVGRKEGLAPRVDGKSDFFLS